SQRYCLHRKLNPPSTTVTWWLTPAARAPVPCPFSSCESGPRRVSPPGAAASASWLPRFHLAGPDRLMGSILLVLIAARVRAHRFQQLLFLRDLHRQVACDSVSDHRCASVCIEVELNVGLRGIIRGKRRAYGERQGQRRLNRIRGVRAQERTGRPAD